MARQSNKPGGFRAGDQVSAGALNKINAAVPREVIGGGGTDVERFGDRILVRGEEQRQTTPAITNYLAWFSVIREFDDYLLCVPYAQTSIDTGNGDIHWTAYQYDPAFSYNPDLLTYVAKPFEFQKTPWDGKVVTLDSATFTVDYSPTSFGRRTITDEYSRLVRTESIDRPYLIGDVICAQRKVTALVGIDGLEIFWIDVNHAARRFVEEPHIFPARLTAAGSPGIFTANITNGSPNVTGVPSTEYLMVGDVLTGTGVPPGTTILAIWSATTFVMSANATATGPINFTISGVPRRYSYVEQKINHAGIYTDLSGGRTGHSALCLNDPTFGLSGGNLRVWLRPFLETNPGTFQLTGSTIQGTAFLSSITPNTNDVRLGYLVSGPGVPDNTTVIAVSAGNITLSQDAVITVAGGTYTITPKPRHYWNYDFEHLADDPPAEIFLHSEDAAWFDGYAEGFTAMIPLYFEDAAGNIQLNIYNASTAVRGVVTTVAQSFAGDKTFVDDVFLPGTNPTAYTHIGTSIAVYDNVFSFNGIGGAGIYHFPGVVGTGESVRLNLGSLPGSGAALWVHSTSGLYNFEVAFNVVGASNIRVGPGMTPGDGASVAPGFYVGGTTGQTGTLGYGATCAGGIIASLGTGTITPPPTGVFTGTLP